MARFKEGDLIAGNNDRFGVTDTNMTKGMVVKQHNNGTIDVRVLEHNKYQDEIGKVFPRMAEGHFVLYEKQVSYVLEDYSDETTIKKGDVGMKYVAVKETANEEHKGVLVGKVLKPIDDDGDLYVMAIDHKDEDCIGNSYYIRADDLIEMSLVVKGDKPVDGESTETPSKKKLAKNQRIRMSTEAGVTFIKLGSHTICVPTTEDLIGVSTKSPEDVENDEMGKALAYFRTVKKTETIGDFRRKVAFESYNGQAGFSGGRR